MAGRGGRRLHARLEPPEAGSLIETPGPAHQAGSPLLVMKIGTGFEPAPISGHYAERWGLLRAINRAVRKCRPQGLHGTSHFQEPP
ncbi:hypothetical protein AGR7A_pTi0081 [Agrobacterium deltaense NCPPB 1641]|uniref:Uncharacterized protein n=1 Tax=Agrobacterium deltaense NCPPB 1641 TaxID=1183425 RepID=A0A1S7UC53_9HYPH|nr:hypothetical protein AGR7A_pTi0081 [Agrobacterium deltaense NCPPB 1641]